MPARHPGKRLGVYPGSPKLPAPAYETIPDNALRHFRDDADAGQNLLRLVLALTEPLRLIAAIQNRLPPGAIVKIPANRLFDAGFEGFLRAPAKLALDFRGVDGIAPVMSGPVGDKCDQPAARLVARRQRLIELAANRLDGMQVCPLVLAADIIGLARYPPLHNEKECAGMIVDEQPIPDILPVAVNGQQFFAPAP